VSGYHLKMVGTSQPPRALPTSSWEWQFQQMRQGRGILVFDDGWHKLSTAIWLFGPIREVRAWVGGTEVLPDITVDAPSTIVWEHDNGIRGVWDITLAPAMYLRSDYYTNDERWEVTGHRGFARVNRCTARGIQQPSLEVYADGEMRSYHALDDDWGSSFRDSGTTRSMFSASPSPPMPVVRPAVSGSIRHPSEMSPDQPVEHPCSDRTE
jgi:predicted dehydrogenase